MKIKLCIILFLIIIATHINAQVKDTLPPKISDHDLGMIYLEKSKKQKTGAWILLGVGLAGWIGGVIAYSNDVDNWYLGSPDPGIGAAILYLIGVGCTVASVPVFIGAAKNKGRAEILLRNENVLIGYNGKNVQSVPAIGISIPIGKR